MENNGVLAMALAYDFDIVSSEDGYQFALFRSPETVAALRGADRSVRDYFASSGFGFDTHNSGAGPGFYPAEDEKARVALIERLSANLWRLDVAKANMNGFDFETFMSELSQAEPIEMQRNAFRFGLPVDRLIQTFRDARPTRTTTG